MIGRPRGVVAIVFGAVAVVAVVAGLLLLGSPAAERNRRLDARRVDDLRALTRTVDLHWTRTGQLPSSLADLTANGGTALATGDPASGAPYDYRVLNGRRFELCARFAATETTTGDRAFWSHPAGEHCFALEAETIDREPVVPVAPRADVPPSDR